MQETTRRQKIEELLRERPEISPSDLRNALSDYKISMELDEIIDEIKELNESIEETVLVEPPRCHDCTFDNFKNVANIPSSCPHCNSTWIREPRFTINND